MFVADDSLKRLFEINAYRQRELDDVFRRIGDSPTNEELKLLHFISAHAVSEAQALYDGIKSAFSGAGEKAPQRLIPQMLLQLALLPEQIKTDGKLHTYLRKEYSYLG